MSLCVCCRARQKKKGKKAQQHQNGSGPPMNVSTQETRGEKEKKEKRRNATERKRKSRANMSTKKKDGENKKRMARYYRQKEEEILSKMQESVATVKDNRKSASYLYILKKAMKSLSTKRDKQSLIKLAALKDILKRSVEVPGKSQPLYQRLKTRDRKVEAFYETEAINLPCQRTAGPSSMKERKVLTKRIEDLYEDFKKKNPSYKISLTTFARRRPSHILLSSSRAFLQCLCEKCENPMLNMKVLNTFLQVKIKHVDHLVEQTLCDYQAFKRSCIDRKCGTCGVDKIILSWKLEQESKLNQQVKWTRWEQTAKSGKDLVEKCSSLDNLFTELQGELQDLAKHLKMAETAIPASAKQFATIQCDRHPGFC